jgi:hypothetical protein
VADVRRHHAQRDTEIIFVEVPVAGSPKSARGVKPGNYPRQDRTPWRPADRPPNKAEKLVKFLDRIQQQDEIVRAYMTPDIAALKSDLRRRRSVCPLRRAAHGIPSSTIPGAAGRRGRGHRPAIRATRATTAARRQAMSRTKEGRDALRSSEAHPQARSIAPAWSKWSQGRVPIGRHRPKPPENGEAHPPSGAGLRHVRRRCPALPR